MGKRRINSFSPLSWSDHQTRGRGEGRKGGGKRGERSEKWKTWGYLAELTSGHNGHKVTVSNYLSVQGGEIEAMGRSMEKRGVFLSLPSHTMHMQRACSVPGRHTLKPP